MKRIRAILNDLGFYNHSRYMEASMTEDNIHAMQLISILAIIASVLFLRVSYLNPGYAVGIYRVTCLLNILINAVIFILMQTMQEKIKVSFHIFHGCLFFYILWLTFFGTVASVTDSQNRGGFIAFLFTQVWAYDLILIPPFVSVILCGVNFLIFTGIISRLTFFPAAKYVETLIFYITIIAVNYFHYRSAVSKISREETMMNDNVRLDHLSTTDALTDVRNRAGLRMDFNHLFGDHLYVMMCDIDNFKHYNDVYGHETGDQILSRFALSLSEEFGHDNVYRYGGDEFLVIVPMASEDEFREKIQRAGWAYANTPLTALSGKTDKGAPGSGDSSHSAAPISGSSVHILDVLNPSAASRRVDNPTSSYGYVHGDCHNADELRAMIQAADVQLYEAKRHGRNQIRGNVFQPA